MKGIKNSFKSRKFKMGGYQTLIMVIVIILVIGLNLVVNKMNITVDLSSQKMFTLTSDTTNLADKIKDKVTLYYMCQDGSEMTEIEKVVDNYDGLGTIKVVKKDPVVYPNFSKTYTDEDIQSNDVIVVNETMVRASWSVSRICLFRIPIIRRCQVLTLWMQKVS